MVKFLFSALSGLLLCSAIFAQNTDYRTRAKALVAQMTLEEKAGLCSGQDFWSTKPIPRLGIPSVFMTDGPHGLRKAVGTDLANSLPATCFPTASALASSWDVDLIGQVGVALGRECQANDVQILLGPGTNMKRSPLGGRNFEYFSEDPVLSGEIAAALINGVQSQGVGTSLKHFAANNQEYERMTMSANPDERTLHEIYFPAFEIAVTKAQPWSVMCAYNKLNGVYCAENPYLLTDVLRRDWGFQGFVVSDWGAVNDRPTGVAAGLNLEMPSSGGRNDQKIVAAVRSGQLKEADLDRSATDLLAVLLKAYDARRPGTRVDANAHHALARQVSADCVVLLKNEGQTLPVQPGKVKKVAVIGSFAKTPRFQGSGSSQVRPTQVANAYDELSNILEPATSLSYAAGYHPDGSSSDELFAEARRQAKSADLAIVFVGLPDSYESEGYDRANIDLPEWHNRLVAAVAAEQPNLVVVLINGSAVAMPWAAQADAIVEGWLGGQAGGGGLADVITGRVNPSGKLSETFPVRLEDTPCYLDFPGKGGEARYGEGIFIGYRYYDKKKIAPQFPFGHGLSYTTFSFEKMTLSAASIKDSDPLAVEITVRNTGKIAGKEVVQLYVREPNAPVIRPEKELRHFAKVSLQPGESKVVRFELSYRDFAWYDPSVHAWQVNSGQFVIMAGGSSARLPLQENVQVEATHKLYPPLTRNSMLKEFAANPHGRFVYDEITATLTATDPNAPRMTPEEAELRRKSSAMMLTFMQDMPVYKVVYMSRGRLTDERLTELLSRIK